MGSEQDRTAQELAKRCAAGQRNPTPCLLQVARNIEHVAQAQKGRLHFIGLQEASRWRELQKRCPSLQGMRVLADKVHFEEIALFFDPSFENLWSATGTISGRPLQVAKFRKAGVLFVVVNVHNHHRHLGTTKLLQEALRNVSGLEQNLADVPKEAVLICLGDWNDPSQKIPGFRPFALCKVPLASQSVSFEDQLPLSCCSTSKGSFQRTDVGDYVLSNYPTSNRVAVGKEIGRLDASDHLPVLAKVRIPDAPKEKLTPSEDGVPFCAVVGFLRSNYINNGKLSITRTLRLQNDIADPNQQPMIDGRPHKGPRVMADARVFSIPPSDANGLVRVVAEVPCR